VTERHKGWEEKDTERKVEGERDILQVREREREKLREKD